MHYSVEARRKTNGSRHRRGWSASACLAFAVSLPLTSLAADEPRRWSDSELVASYAELKAAGRLSEAILRPSLPSESPEKAFLDALAWFAAGTPAGPGELTLAQLDRFVRGQAQVYGHLLEAKVEQGEENDYPRTRTWKVIQKLTLLRNEMSSESGGGRYEFAATPSAREGEDPWEREHTLSSPEEFDLKVCRASFERPVLVKFGNTNCTQCMLFEMIGSIKDLAESPGYSGKVDVYKVWFGMRPDASFAGKIRDPERLEQLAAAEGIRSSPSFVVYRDGRRHVCGSAFPDSRGVDAHLDACLDKASPASPASGVCAVSTAASS